ncbi:PREDICTED: cinnamoyl-CoA reductase-like SNL6 isoform X2 [Ipomoea nil]|uniref:cinnamoyl-CoA reductase-like SNL6 isoform X2 n=1 Tax=Ipomoea nil TaxID=35883 RepID=UPI0009019C53|nr:PREDICTED: cinnamoyl-CoA reductase-like SNL6 isoform X2 [Ipomoea nil]
MAPPPSFNCELNTVCVMDASSYLGSLLVRRLLHRGYTVHAAIQTHAVGGEEALAPLNVVLEWENNEKVKVFELDLFDYHSIVDALKGCCGLFYSFEPPLDHSTYDEYMGEVEVRAAHNVVEACAQTDSIDKVVFTSSATAIIWNSTHADKRSSDLDERHWSDINFCRNFKLWHALSKTVAEKSAWALAMDRGVNMVSVNAGLVLSPDLTITNPYLKGAAEMYEDGVFVTVDLDFLVDAHVSVYEDVSTYGRYLCFNHTINHTAEAAKLAQTLNPSSSHLPRCEDETRIIEQRISNKKLNKVMVDFDRGSHVQVD